MNKALTVLFVVSMLCAYIGWSCLPVVIVVCVVMASLSRSISAGDAFGFVLTWAGITALLSLPFWISLALQRRD